MRVPFFRSKQLGFTLVELLVVLTIIGVLATLIVANFSSARERARDARRKKELQEVKTALRLYYNDYQNYPNASSGRIAGCGGSGTSACTWGGAFETTAEEYMKRLPIDPLNDSGNGYIYTYTQTNSGQGFRITAKLENQADPEIGDSQDRCGGSGSQTYSICED